MERQKSKFKNIVLIGFMCTGKDAVGSRLASHLGLDLINTDELIECREKRSIPKIFEDEGEKYFRDIETQVLKSLAQIRHSVISCGGGIILKSGNRNLLKKLGVVIWLEAEPGVINRRLKKLTDRPLLNIKAEAERLRKINELLKFRRKYYKMIADVTIDTSKLTISGVVKKIERNLGKQI